MTKRQENLNRVCKGRNIVHSNERYANNTNVLPEVLLDLLHYAEENGLDFDAALRWAKAECAQDCQEAEEEKTS